MENQNTHYVLAFDLVLPVEGQFSAPERWENRDERDPPLFE